MLWRWCPMRHPLGKTLFRSGVMVRPSCSHPLERRRHHRGWSPIWNQALWETGASTARRFPDVLHAIILYQKICIKCYRKSIFTGKHVSYTYNRNKTFWGCVLCNWSIRSTGLTIICKNRHCNAILHVMFWKIPTANISLLVRETFQ